jgi:hypothetical protein
MGRHTAETRGDTKGLAGRGGSAADFLGPKAAPHPYLNSAEHKKLSRQIADQLTITDGTDTISQTGSADGTVGF